MKPCEKTASWSQRKGRRLELMLWDSRRICEFECASDLHERCSPGRIQDSNRQVCVRRSSEAGRQSLDTIALRVTGLGFGI